MSSSFSAAAVRSPSLPYIGLLTVALGAAALAVLMERTRLGAVIFEVLLLIVVSIPVLWRQGIRERDRAVFVVLLVGLVMKLLGGVLRYYATVEIYGEPADAGQYHRFGAELVPYLRSGDFAAAFERAASFGHLGSSTGFGALTGTYLMPVVTGLIYSITGVNFIGGYVFFAWLGYWGLFFFYRAFLLLEEGSVTRYRFLVFFLPSLLFWSSGLGKDALMLLAIGLTAFGTSYALKRRVPRGLILVSLGLGLAAVIRPHFAGMLAIALGASFVFYRPRRELRELIPLIKGITLLLLIMGAAFFAIKAQEYIGGADVDTEAGILETLNSATERLRLAEGGSDFRATPITSPLRVPLGAFTVLLRPHILDAVNLQTWIAAIESTVLLTLCIVYRRGFWRGLTAFRRNPYLVFVAVYLFLGVVAFSTVGNFGILARQRVQILPAFLVFLALAPNLKRQTTIAKIES